MEAFGSNFRKMFPISIESRIDLEKNTFFNSILCYINHYRNNIYSG